MSQQNSDGKSLRTRRSPAKLGDKLDKHLLAYTAAAAAGLIAVSPAHAEIVFQPLDVVISPAHSYEVDLLGNGNSDAVIYVLSIRPQWQDLNIAGLGSAVFGAAARSLYYALALNAGQQIDSKLDFYGRFSSVSGGPALASVFYGEVSGDWANKGNHYLGFRFFEKGEFHYGWMRLSVHQEGSRLSAHLSGVAFEAIPDKPIVAGARREMDEPDAGLKPQVQVIPQNAPRASSSLGQLALGSAGLRAIKK